MTTAVTARTPASRRRRSWRNQLIRIPAILVALALWQVGATALDSAYFPPFLTIADRFVNDWFSGPWQQAFLSDGFLTNATPTLLRLLLGWLVGTVLGVLIGSMIAMIPRLGAALDPLVRFGMSMPAPALLPIALALFGLGTGGKVFFIAFGAIWPVIIGTAAGLRDADPVVLNSARSLVLGRVRMFFQVRIPLASPQIMSGIRVSVNAAVLLIVVAELYATTSGVGFQIVITQRSFDVVGTWSGIFLLALIGIVANGLYVLVESRVMRWQIAPREAQS